MYSDQEGSKTKPGLPEFSRGKFKVTHSLHKTHLINNVDEDMRNGKKQKSSLYKSQSQEY